MANQKLEDRIQELRRLRSAPLPGVEVILRKALTDRSNLVIAEAARSSGELRLSELIPDLLAAFDKLFEDPLKTDPKCWGKIAIVKALTQLDYSESAPFIRGSKHIQMEPVMGGREDSAPHLRGSCLLALVQCGDLRRVEILRCMVDGLSDPADAVRLEAVRALHQLGGDESVLLLRLKARTGDERPLIIGHAFDALLSLEREQAVPFVAGFIKTFPSNANEELRDEAALALGASRLSSAVNVLIEQWKEAAFGEPSRVLLRAISSSRLPEGIDFLLGILKSGNARQSAGATEALQIHKDTPEIQALVDAAQKERL